MNKAELVEAIAESSDVSKAVALRCVESMLDTIRAALAHGDSVTMAGFGTFSVKERAARIGRNPQTGATINLAASKLPGFKASKALKDAVN